MQLDVPFKGSRNYLQSANIWDAVAGVALSSGSMHPEAQLDVIIRRRIDHVLTLVAADAPAMQGAERPAAEATISWPGGRQRLNLFETDGVVASRIDDPEGQLRMRCTIGGETCTADGPFPFSASQVVVALTKFLHEASVDGSVKWLATRLMLPLAVLENPPERVEITLNTRLGHGTVSSAGLKLPGQAQLMLGRVFFHKSTW